MNPDISEIVNRFWSDQPHPQNPALKIGEYATAVRLATQAKFGGHASPQEAGAFWTEFQSMNENLAAQGKQPVSPHEMGHLLEQMGPVSFAFHGRPPSMREIAQHRDSSPKAVRDYYSELPDTTYPHVPAGGMVGKLQSANVYAQIHLGRRANKLEASHFYHGNMGPEQINGFYAGLKQQKGDVQAAQPPEPKEGQDAGQDRVG